MNLTTQSELAIDFAPASLRLRGLAGAHSRPLVGYGKDADGVWQPAAGDSRTTPRKAWRYPELEWTQTATYVVALALDIDDMDAFLAARLRFDAGGTGAPEPSVMVTRRANDHAHVVYILADPVWIGPGAKGHQVAMLKRIEAWLVEATGADPSYPAVLAHNPMRTRHASKRDWRTDWGRRKAYRLGELSKAIRKGFRTPRRPQGGVNRLCALLRELGAWYGKPANWWLEFDAVLAHALELDRGLAKDTGYVVGDGLRPTVRAVFDNQRADLEKGVRQAAFSAMQSRRGRKSSRAIGEAQQDLLRQHRRDGATIEAAAAGAGVSKRTAQSIVGGTRSLGRRRRDRRRQQVRALLAEGLSLRAIARRLGCTHPTILSDAKAIEAQAKPRQASIEARNAAFLAQHRSRRQVVEKCK